MEEIIFGSKYLLELNGNNKKRKSYGERKNEEEDVEKTKVEREKLIQNKIFKN